MKTLAVLAIIAATLALIGAAILLGPCTPGSDPGIRIGGILVQGCR